MIWNPWHGCHKKSAGCLNCYMFRRDSMYNKDSNIISKTKDFDLAIRKNKKGEYKIPSKEVVYTCMTSDFFIPEADLWRDSIWHMIKERSDVTFYIITKRIERMKKCLPSDWHDGYDNVIICATIENEEMANERLPILLNLPIKHREVIMEPMLSKIDIKKFLQTGLIENVTCGGESGENARECHYEWILKVREDCLNNKVSFYFKQTGANFIKDHKRYKITRSKQLIQAKKANINLEF